MKDWEKRSEWKAIGHFRVPFSLHFKVRLSAKSLLWKSVFIHIEIGTNYHNKSFALRLALKERLRGTRKWLIEMCKNEQATWKPQSRERYCLLITLTCSPKAELRRAQLNEIGWMHVKGASGSHQTAMNDPGAQQPSQMFLTWVKTRPQHRELRALLFTSIVWVL